MNAFIDLDNQGQALALVQYASELIEDPSFLEKNKALIESGKTTEVFHALISQAHNFFKGPQEIELTFNSLARLVRVQSPAEIPKLVEKLGAAIADSSVKGHELSRLKVLGTLFNNMDANSLSRYDTYMHVISLAGSSGNIKAILPQLKNLSGWLKQWGADITKQRAMYKHLYKTLAAAGQQQASIDHLRTLLKSYNKAVKGTLAEVKAEATELLSLVIAHPSLFNEKATLELDAVKQLSGSKEFELLSLVVAGDLAKFEAWAKSNKSAFGTALDEEAVRRKVKLMTLTALCASYTSAPLAYSEVAKSLSVEEDSVEMWVIDGIRSGLIEAKIDEVNSQLSVTRSTAVNFDRKNWEDLKTRLVAWRSNIGDVQKTLDGVRTQVSRQLLQTGVPGR